MRIKNKNAAILPLKSGAKLFLILFVGLSTVLTSCKESNVIGLDVQPPNDLIGVYFQDTTTLITKTVRADSLRTDELQLPLGGVVMGSYWDPIFGKTYASLYTQVRPVTVNPSFGTSPVVDSVVLSIVYDPTYYGKRQCAQQKVNVYQLMDPLKPNIAYFSNRTINAYPDDLASNYVFTPHPTDSLHILNSTLKPQLRIPLENYFGQGLLDQEFTHYNSTASFLTYLQGFYITMESSTLSSQEGNILYFRCSDPQSKLTVYYHNASADSLSYDYALSGVDRFSRFRHDYSSANSELTVQLGSTPPAQNNNLFIQSMAGLRAKIEMPYLMGWLHAGRIAINKAELVIKVNVEPTYLKDTFKVPAKLVLIGINDDGSDYALPDAGPYERAGYFGGGYDSTTFTYHLNIARYVQEVLTGVKKNNGLHLVASAAQLNGNRVVVGGGAPGLYQMKLNIGYTKLEY
jgi:hypothetical protein